MLCQSSFYNVLKWYHISTISIVQKGQQQYEYQSQMKRETERKRNVWQGEIKLEKERQRGRENREKIKSGKLTIN